ncbi:hypothetical protein RchiOBHm_Chr1g0375601 [Rosa chinensis]|uniref:Uncharacterized protein n=1 Tax=Rosa chinensis TaxID=74649 RepID=A0A2P6SMP2_ROSCH|nr:hypothetical protein RchiOBHm_Chr1g0375601 [Rosa chinensis]
MAISPSPQEAMSIFVERILEWRDTCLLNKLLVKPSLVNQPLLEEEGALLLYLRMLAWHMRGQENLLEIWEP